MLGPYTSASNSPTLAPLSASAQATEARLEQALRVVVVDADPLHPGVDLEVHLRPRAVRGRGLERGRARSAGDLERLLKRLPRGAGPAGTQIDVAQPQQRPYRSVLHGRVAQQRTRRFQMLERARQIALAGVGLTDPAEAFGLDLLLVQPPAQLQAGLQARHRALRVAHRQLLPADCGERHGLEGTIPDPADKSQGFPVGVDGPRVVPRVVVELPQGVQRERDLDGLARCPIQLQHPLVVVERLLPLAPPGVEASHVVQCRALETAEPDRAAQLENLFEQLKGSAGIAEMLVTSERQGVECRGLSAPVAQRTERRDRLAEVAESLCRPTEVDVVDAQPQMCAGPRRARAIGGRQGQDPLAERGRLPEIAEVRGDSARLEQHGGLFLPLADLGQQPSGVFVALGATLQRLGRALGPEPVRFIPEPTCFRPRAVGRQRRSPLLQADGIAAVGVAFQRAHDEAVGTSALGDEQGRFRARLPRRRVRLEDLRAVRGEHDQHDVGAALLRRHAKEIAGGGGEEVLVGLARPRRSLDPSTHLERPLRGGRNRGRRHEGGGHPADSTRAHIRQLGMPAQTRSSPSSAGGQATHWAAGFAGS